MERSRAKAFCVSHITVHRPFPPATDVSADAHTPTTDKKKRSVRVSTQTILPRMTLKVYTISTILSPQKRARTKTRLGSLTRLFRKKRATGRHETTTAMAAMTSVTKVRSMAASEMSTTRGMTRKHFPQMLTPQRRRIAYVQSCGRQALSISLHMCTCRSMFYTRERSAYCMFVHTFPLMLELASAHGVVYC